MIIAFLCLLLAVIVETQVFAVAGYVIACIALVAAKGLKQSLAVIVATGIVLDVLTPRHLGISPLVVMLVLLTQDIALGQSRRETWLSWAVSLILVIGEGLVTGRSMWGVVASMGILTVILAWGKLLTSPNKAIIVRRQL